MVELLLLCAGVSTVLGFAWLALAMDVHWRQVFTTAQPDQSTRTTLRCMGVSGLLAALGFCLLADHPSMAALVWIMFLAAGAVLVSMTLTVRPGVLRFAWPLYKLRNP